MFICVHPGEQKILELLRDEHKSGTKWNNAIKQHAETMGHNIHPNFLETLEPAKTLVLILESWHLTTTNDAVTAVNEC